MRQRIHPTVQITNNSILLDNISHLLQMVFGQRSAASLLNMFHRQRAVLHLAQMFT